MRVLVDTNIILDFLLEREPFLKSTEAFFERIVTGQIMGYVSASSVTDIFYITERQTRDIDKAQRAIALILKLFQICPVDYTTLSTAYNFGLPDFEDAVQVACAIAQQLDAIVTRNAKDFPVATVPVLNVNQILERLE